MSTCANTDGYLYTYMRNCAEIQGQEQVSYSSLKQLKARENW